MNSIRLPFSWHHLALPILWGLAILVVSGDFGSSQNTLGLVKWLLSWIPALRPLQVQAIHGFLRKLGHILAYGILYLLWFRAFNSFLPGRRLLCLVLAMLCCLSVALLDEGHQGLVAARRGSFHDVRLDLFGAGISAVLILAFWKPRGPGG
jgi:VanZ family protein